jgi:hypothetical protein
MRLQLRGCVVAAISGLGKAGELFAAARPESD